MIKEHVGFNEFQLALKRHVEEAAEDVSLVVEVSEFKGVWDGENEIAFVIRVPARELEFWIYCDGAQISGPNLDRRFEKEDYDDLDQLASRYRAEVSRVLKEGKINAP